MAGKPTIGLIVPPAGGLVPPECPALYGDRASFIAAGLGLDRLTPDGYDGVVDSIAGHAERLAGRGADAVVLMGTSMSFYRGAAFNRRLVDIMRAETGLPATTMSNAVVDALRVLGARRVAVGTAYTDPVNRRLVEFLAVSGFTVTALASLNIEAVDAIADVGQDDLLDLGRRAYAEGRDAHSDAILVSCGGLHTLDVTTALEAETGIPMVSSAVAGSWAALRLSGCDATARGRGRLLEPPA